MPSSSRVLNQWLAKAKEDLLVAKVLSESHSQAIETIAFHCQQCIEKSIKAYLVFNKVRTPKTHKLSELCGLSEHDFLKHFQNISINRVSDYAVKFRYPDAELEEISSSEIESVIQLAQAIFDEVIELVSSS